MAINNIIWGSRQMGININYGATNSKIYNNTIYGNKYGIVIGPEAIGSRVINNITYNNSNGNIQNSGVNTTLRDNLTENPLFISPDNGNFNLQDGSPAINAGMILAEVNFDFDYKPRPTKANYDIGAFQSGNFLPPPTALRTLTH